MKTQASGWRPPIASGPPGTRGSRDGRRRASGQGRGRAASRQTGSGAVGCPGRRRAAGARARGVPARTPRPRASAGPGIDRAPRTPSRSPVRTNAPSAAQVRNVVRPRTGRQDRPKLDVARVQRLEVGELPDLVRQRPAAARTGERPGSRGARRRPRRRRRGPGSTWVSATASMAPPRAAAISSARSSAGPVGSPGSTSTNRRRPTR